MKTIFTIVYLFALICAANAKIELCFNVGGHKLDEDIH